MADDRDKQDSPWAEIRDALRDVEGACEQLPEEEKESYRAARQSIVEARRHAELCEGFIQIC